MMIDDLFYVKRGVGGYRENLEIGNTPLVSATSINNGVLDFVDVSPTFKAPCITVERVGGNAFVQLIDFVTVPDDISVLVPKSNMTLEGLLKISTQINLESWRFNYGRKLSAKRLKKMEIQWLIESTKNVTIGINDRFPKRSEKKYFNQISKFGMVPIEQLFKIDRGDFHALDRLDPGDLPTISRISLNNGVTGYFELPEGAKIYSKGIITISTVSGDAFVQLEDFICTDNVLICNPKYQFRDTTLFFIACMINLQKWRFSYGRQPYKRVFLKLSIPLPKIAEKLDEDLIENIVKNCYGWNIVETKLNG